MRTCPILLMAITACWPALAGEFAVFASGSRIQADRHEHVGNVIRLYQGSGVTEIPASLVVEFEVFEDPQPQLSQGSEPVAVQETAPTLSPSNDPKQLIREAALRSGLPPA
ncbi:MAG: hypothetical protein RL328_2342, partial [Acidobacteriota bacterium]